MAIKKPGLYSSLWASCDELRGGMINTQVIQSLIEANERLARSPFPDFSDPHKLGEGQAMVDRLSNLIGVLQETRAACLEAAAATNLPIASAATSRYRSA